MDQTNNLKLIVLLIISLLGIILVHKVQSLQIKDKYLFIPPPPQIENFTFGYREVMADLFWIRAIQDIDYCEKKDSMGRCDGSPWVYPMLDAITRLSPKYRIIYAAGGPILSVLINDREGARVLFERGVKEFPNDWRILYRAAYHYLYETTDKKRAAELFIMAGKAGAPPWVYSLAQRLYADEGYPDVGDALIKDLESQGFDESIIQRMKDRIKERSKASASSSSKNSETKQK